MTTIELKTNFHNLIDSVKNDKMLSAFYDIIERETKKENYTLWNKLSEEQKSELLEIELESRNEDSLIDHSIMKEKYKKWL